MVDLDKTDNTESKHGRPTIGLISKLGYATVEGYESVLLSGIVDTTRERNVNLICFAGGQLVHDVTYEFLPQRNIVYDLASPDNIDGLIVVGSTMVAHEGDLEKLQIFCDQYHPLPMVSIGLTLDGIPSIQVDNHSGFRELMQHLIEEHGCQRIAFIRGPEGHSEAEQRYKAYLESLKQHDIPLDSNLIMPGDFLPPSGEAAIKILIDQRGLQPRNDFDAIIAASDYMAYGALDALRKRGIRVPYDVAVAGFDDIAEAKFFTPPLTTVRQSIYELGKQAVEKIVLIMGGWKTSESVTLPTSLVVRQSCGCLGLSVTKVVEGIHYTSNKRTKTFDVIFARRRSLILTELESSLKPLLSGPDAMLWCVKLLDSFCDDLNEYSKHKFLQVLDGLLRTLTEKKGDVSSFDDVLSTMRREILPIITEQKLLILAENIWQQGRVMIKGTTERLQAHMKHQSEEQARTLHTISQELITTFDVPGIMDLIVQEFPRLGIENFYISLYENQYTSSIYKKDKDEMIDSKLNEASNNGNPAIPVESKRIPSKWSRLILAHDGTKRLELNENGTIYPTIRLLPEGLLSGKVRFALLAKSLFFRDDLFGVVYFGLEPLVGTLIYETLRLQISSALKGAKLYQERKQVEDRIQKELEEKEVLLKEINHRVKNNLNVVASLLNLQSSKIQNKEQALNAFKVSRDRIHTMAIMHEKLYKSKEFARIDMKWYIEKMIQELFHTYGARENIKSEIKIKDVFLDINAAIPCGLILNELITNALKYAFPDNRPGRIEIVFSQGKNNQYDLIVSDDGIGLLQDIDEQPSESLGLKLVRVLTEQLDGNLKIDSEGGTRFHISFPVLGI